MASEFNVVIKEPKITAGAFRRPAKNRAWINSNFLLQLHPAADAVLFQIIHWEEIVRQGFQNEMIKKIEGDKHLFTGFLHRLFLI